MEFVFVPIFLYEEELVLSLPKRRPAWRKIEEHSIEGELELVLPLLHLHVLTSLSIERIESATRLIVRDDKRVIAELLDTVDLSCELYISEIDSTSDSAKVIFEEEFLIFSPHDLSIE